MMAEKYLWSKNNAFSKFKYERVLLINMKRLHMKLMCNLLLNILYLNRKKICGNKKLNHPYRDNKIFGINGG